MNNFVCKTCNSEFVSKKACKNRVPKFCSTKCYGESLTAKENGTCKYCNGEIIKVKNISIKQRIFCSVLCQSNARKGIPLSATVRKSLSEGRKKSLKCKGENLYNWKGGKATESFRMKQHYYKRKNGLKMPMPFKFLENVLLAQKGLCFFCETSLANYKAIEHLTPVSKGGDNDVFNLVYCCKSCNSKKRQKTLEEFAIANRRFDWVDKWEDIFLTAVEL